MSTTTLTDLDIEAVARAIELDAGQSIPNLRRSLNDAKAMTGRVTTPQQIAARRVGRPPLTTPKQAVKIRLDADILEALRATGKGWQTRVNGIVRDSLSMHATGQQPTTGA
jgi:uncharacterized protein (DUF4415 family)